MSSLQFHELDKKVASQITKIKIVRCPVDKVFNNNTTSNYQNIKNKWDELKPELYQSWKCTLPLKTEQPPPLGGAPLQTLNVLQIATQTNFDLAVFITLLSSSKF